MIANRNLACGAVVLALAGLLCPPLAGAEVAGLQDQLEKGLKARRPQEFAFIATVVTMTANDTLPLDLVQSTFLWARKKAKTKPYPFPYFERALRERAREQGIDIP